MTIHYMQKLTGLLNFFCKAIYPGRAFTRRLYAKFSSTNLMRYHHIRVDKELRKDCNMWKQFLVDREGNYCRPFVDFSLKLLADELNYYTDASFQACAGYFDGRYFMQPWEPGMIQASHANISLLELYAIAVSITLWSKYLKNCRVIIYSDSESSMTMVNQASSKCPRCMHLIRHITKISMEDNNRFFLRHVVGKRNKIADRLSRLDIKGFRALVPINKLVEPAEKMPTSLWPIPLHWWCD